MTRDAIKTTGTIAICKFNKLIITSPGAVAHGYDWLDTLAHEYTHLVVSKKSRNTVPIWMHEGLANYLETAWRGAPGQAMSPSMLALLGARVRANTLVPFEKMYPSMALLPTAEDAATAFAEVFFAIKQVHQENGPDALKRLLEEMERGHSDKQAVEAVTHKKWAEQEPGDVLRTLRVVAEVHRVVAVPGARHFVPDTSYRGHRVPVRTAQAFPRPFSTLVGEADSTAWRSSPSPRPPAVSSFRGPASSKS